MKDLIWKLQPYLTGGLIGWLAFWPPAFTESWGWWRYLLMGSLAGFAFLGSLTLMVLQSLPENLAVQPLGRPLHDPEVQRLAESLHLLGFRQASEPLLVGIKPPAALVPFTHLELPAYATVFRLGTLPAKVSFDMFSVLDGYRGGLTTLNNPAGAVLPPAPGALKQVFPGAAPERLLAEHRAALAGLAKQGLVFLRPEAGAFANLFRLASARQRKAFLRSPLRGCIAILWRLASKDSPFLGPVLSQRGAQEQIRRLVSGG